MTRPLEILVLAGGLSHERDVSLRSGRRVADALRSVGVGVEIRDSDSTLLAALAGHPPDAAFIALHGGPGEDGALRGVLDLVGVPYVGAGPAACRLAFDKPTAKALVAAAGVPTPRGVALPATTFRELGAAAVLDQLVASLGLPLMVKPASGGSALGATVVRQRAELAGAMVTCFSYGPVALVERYLTGVEVSVAVLDTGSGPVALPAVEVVVTGGGAYDYQARYTAGETDFYVPARLTAASSAAAADAALVAHRALGLRDVSRSDLIVDEAGTVHFLEANVSPGMTETSLLPTAAAEAGLNLGELCLRLLERAVRRARLDAPAQAG